MIFKDMLAEQEQFQASMGWPMRRGYKAMEKNAIALMVETAEILQELPWKPWKHQPDPVEEDKLLEEIVDAQKFLCNIINELYTEEEFQVAWELKNEKIKERIRNGY